MKKITVVFTAALFMVTLLAGCVSDSGIYKAGAYTATAKGYSGDVTVEVEFDKDSILSVKVTEQSETAGIGDLAVEKLPEKIVEAQTWELDCRFSN